MFSRLSPTALLRLEPAYSRELGALPLMDARSLKPQQRALATNAWTEACSSVFDPATPAYLALHNKIINVLDTPFNANLLRYINSSVHLYVDHVAWARVLGPKDVFINMKRCDLAMALQIARICECIAISISATGVVAFKRGQVTVTYNSESILAEIRALGGKAAAFAGFEVNTNLVELW